MARLFTESQFAVRQSIVYTDPQTDKLRELDVVAYPLQLPSSPVRLMLAIECKKSGHPWITRRAYIPSGQLTWVPIGDEGPAAYLVKKRILTGSFALAQKPPFDVLQVMDNKGDQNPAHNAMLQVVGATRAVAAAEDFASLAFPVIVLDGDLISVEYDRDGNEVLEPRGHERILWSGQPNGERVVIDVVTRSTLGEYAKAMYAALKDLDEELRLADRGELNAPL